MTFVWGLLEWHFVEEIEGFKLWRLEAMAMAAFALLENKKLKSWRQAAMATFAYER